MTIRQSGDGEKNYTHYYEKCPQSHAYHDSGSFECKPSCGDKPYVPGDAENVCVDKCSTTELKFTDLDNRCVENCSSGHFLTNKTEKYCTKKCPETSPFTSDGECVPACPENEFLQPDGDTCGPECESAAYRTETRGNGSFNACVADTEESCPYYTEQNVTIT